MVPADFVARLTAVRLLAFDTTVALGARPAPNAIEPGHTHQPSAASTDCEQSSHARWPDGRTEEPHARAAQRAYSPNIHHAPPAQSQASATRRVVARLSPSRGATSLELSSPTIAPFRIRRLLGAPARCAVVLLTLRLGHEHGQRPAVGGYLPYTYPPSLTYLRGRRSWVLHGYRACMQIVI